MTISYFLSDGHPTWIGANTVKFNARTDQGARREAKKLEKEHLFDKPPTLFFHAGDHWSEIK